ncbi:MAG: hypothetical protein AB2764_15095 [Candidatus Thiodiazotropha endolucinida]
MTKWMRLIDGAVDVFLQLENKNSRYIDGNSANTDYLILDCQNVLYVSIQNKTGSEICLNSASLGNFERLVVTSLEVGGHIRFVDVMGIAEQLSVNYFYGKCA